jgi:hypothetical protein
MYKRYKAMFLRQLLFLRSRRYEMQTLMKKPVEDLVPPIKICCHRCEYAWYTRVTQLMHRTCPSCQAKVRIPIEDKTK